MDGAILSFSLFGVHLVCALLLGGLVFGALCLLTEDILKEKWQEYLITAGAFVILDILQKYVYSFGILPLFEVIALVWVPYKWLDYSLVRSFGVLGISLGGLYAIGWAFNTFIL